MRFIRIRAECGEERFETFTKYEKIVSISFTTVRKDSKNFEMQIKVGKEVLCENYVSSSIVDRTNKSNIKTYKT